jgi:hypothetical protein
MSGAPRKLTRIHATLAGRDVPKAAVSRCNKLHRLGVSSEHRNCLDLDQLPSFGSLASFSDIVLPRHNLHVVIAACSGADPPQNQNDET